MDANSSSSHVAKAGPEMILRNRSVKRAASNDDKRLPTSTTSSRNGFVKPESLASRRMVPNIAVSMRQTLCDTNNVVITPPLGQQLVENSFTFNSPRARTSTMKRNSLSPSLANPPELSPIRKAMTAQVNTTAVIGGAIARPEPIKVKDKSSKRKSNLNIAFNEEATGNVHFFIILMNVFSNV